MAGYPGGGSELKKSRFNSAWLKFERMSNLWNNANDHARAGYLDKWNWDLDRVWCELCAHDSQDNSEKELKDIDTEFFKKETTRTKKYELLMKKEKILRKLEDSAGLTTAYEEEDDEEY